MKRPRKPPSTKVRPQLAFRKWCEEFQKGNAPRSGIVLHNVLYDCSRKRLSDEVLEAFRAAFRRTVRSQPADGLIRKIVEDDPAHLLCQGCDSPAPAACSRIMNGKDLLERNIHLRQLGRSVPVLDVAAAIRNMQSAGLRGIAKNQMRGRLPLAWVTKTSAVDVLRRMVRPERLADELRDHLGLHHLREDQYLVEVVYPPGEPQTLRAPTFLDGNDIVFRSKRGPDEWGRTVNLRTLEDGLPEAVHSPIRFTEHFRVRDIGRLRSSRGVEFEKVAGWQRCRACTGASCKCRIEAGLTS